MWGVHFVTHSNLQLRVFWTACCIESATLHLSSWSSSCFDHYDDWGFADFPFVKVFVNIPSFHPNNSPQLTNFYLLLTWHHHIQFPVPINYFAGINLAPGFHASYSICQREYLLFWLNLTVLILLTIIKNCARSFSVQNLSNLLSFVHPNIKAPKSVIKEPLDASNSTSHRVFMAWNCKEWCTNYLNNKFLAELQL